MSILFSRTAMIPVWLLVFGLFVFNGSPMTFATGLVLLLMGGMALTIMLVLWKKPLPTIAVTMPDPPQATLSSADFVPNSWPNSGFRNSRQRGTRGG